MFLWYPVMDLARTPLVAPRVRRALGTRMDFAKTKIIATSSPRSVPTSVLVPRVLPSLTPCFRPGSFPISFPEPAILGKEPGILAKIELRIPFQRPIRFLSETDYPRASRSFPRIARSGNEIGSFPARFHNRSGE